MHSEATYILCIFMEKIYRNAHIKIIVLLISKILPFVLYTKRKSECLDFSNLQIFNHIIR